MAAGTLNFTGKLAIEIGSKWEKMLTLKRDSAIWNLNDYTVKMSIKEDYDSEESLLDLTTENDKIVLTPDEGKLILRLLASDIEDLPAPDIAIYDVFLVPPSGDDSAIKLLTGNIEIKPRVTI
jgi:hypothetical protein